MGGRFRHPPIDLLKKNCILQVGLQYPKMYKVYKYEVIAQMYGPRPLWQMLNEIDWFGSFGHINYTSLVGTTGKNNGKGKSRLCIPMHNNNWKIIFAKTKLFKTKLFYDNVRRQACCLVCRLNCKVLWDSLYCLCLNPTHISGRLHKLRCV